MSTIKDPTTNLDVPVDDVEIKVGLPPNHHLDEPVQGVMYAVDDQGWTTAWVPAPVNKAELQAYQYQHVIKFTQAWFHQADYDIYMASLGSPTE